MISLMTAPAGARKRLRRLALAALVALGLMQAPAAGAGGAAAFESAMDAVLVLRTDDAEDRFLGSAFLWGEDGLVAVTNAHVVGDAERVRLIDRHGVETSGEVIARDEVRDVAVISLPRGGAPRRGLVPAEGAATLGQEVFALGAPLGVEFTLTEGLVSATGRQVDIARPLRLLQHDAAVNPGSSGGPLVDARGRLLGMNSRIADGSRMFVGIAYAIAADDLERIVTGLVDETLEPFPQLGLTVRPVDRRVADALGIAPAGLLVDGAAPRGLAEAAGLKAGDVILAVDGADLARPGDFAFAIERALEAGLARLEVRRDGAPVSVTLDFRPAPGTAPGTAGGVADGGGLRLRDLSAPASAPERVTSYRLGALGVVLGEDGAVRDVTMNSPALGAGLGRGDRIIAVNGEALGAEALAALEITGPALLLVQAPGGQTRHVYLDPWGPSGTVRPVGGANVLDPAVSVF